MNQLQVRKANNNKCRLRTVPNNPFSEADSWKTHFQQIQNGATPVADRVWHNIPTSPTTADWLNNTPTQDKLT